MHVVSVYLSTLSPFTFRTQTKNIKIREYLLRGQIRIGCLSFCLLSNIVFLKFINLFSKKLYHLRYLYFSFDLTRYAMTIRLWKVYDNIIRYFFPSFSCIYTYLHVSFIGWIEKRPLSLSICYLFFHLDSQGTLDFIFFLSLFVFFFYLITY